MDAMIWTLALIGLSVFGFLAGQALGIAVERKRLTGAIFPVPDEKMPGPVERAYKRRAAREKRMTGRELRTDVIAEDPYGVLAADELEERG